jgi:SAM-dependent methyltransferase
MSTSPHEQSTIRPPHPLAIELSVRLRDRAGARVLDYCAGSGRNGAFLRENGFEVVAVDDVDATSFDRASPVAEYAGIVSSHGLLHGYAPAMTARIAALAGRLETGGWLCATFGSRRDARCGTGIRLDEATFAAADGDEAGVPHAYFDESSLRALLAPYFDVALLSERDATQTAGRWAHTTPLNDAVHWFAIARHRAD